MPVVWNKHRFSGGLLILDATNTVVLRGDAARSFDRFEDARIQSRNTHGTGCTLASAIAAGLAQKMSLRDAVARARAYVRAAIETAPGYGGGLGPLNHAVTVRSG